MTKKTKAAEYELITPIGETTDETRNLPAGSLVKLIFGSVTSYEKYQVVESMWVGVTSRNGDIYSGTLANTPFDRRSLPLKLGDKINFTADQIRNYVSVEKIADHVFV